MYPPKPDEKDRPPGGSGTSDVNPEEPEDAGKDSRTIDNRNLANDPLAGSGRMVSKTATFLSLFAIIVAGAVLLALYKPRKRSHEEQVLGCNTPQCADALFYLEAMGNPNVDPCQDFYAHVCSKWQQGRDGEGFLKDALWNFLIDLHHRISHQAAAPTPRLSEAMKTMDSLYSSCHDFLAGNVSLDTAINSIENTLNAAKILHSRSLAEALQSVLQLSLTHGIASTLEIRFRKSPSKRFLHFLWRGSLREKIDENGDVRMLERYITEVARAFSHNATAEELLRLDRDVGSLSSKALKIQLRPFYSLEEVGAPFTIGFWRETIGSVVPGVRDVRDVEPVVTVGYTQMKHSMEMLRSGPLRVVTAYLSLQTLANVLAFDYFKRYRAQSSSDSIRICLGATKNALKTHWLSVIHSKTSDVGSSRDVQSIFDNVKQYYVTTTPAWMDKRTMLKSKAKIRGIILRLYKEKNDTTLSDNPVFPMVESGFVQDYLTLLTWSHQHFIRFPPDTALEDQQDSEFTGSPLYSRKFESVFIPAFLQQKPVSYPSLVAPYFNYGTLGSLIAKELSEAIGPKEQSMKQLGGHKDAWPLSAWRQFHNASACYKPFFERAHVQGDQASNLSSRQKNSLFVWSRGARIAYESAISELPRLLAKFHLATAQQIFFRRFCLLSCDTIDVNAAREQCMVPLMNMREFAIAFRCTENSVMNPRERCPEL